MILFPNCKVNIGLYIVKKRKDGYHNLKSIFYPIELSDILEITLCDEGNGQCFFKSTGIEINCDDDQNLVVKAYKILAGDFELPSVKVHLHKVIPFGAGLGGGSSDAAFMLKGLNELCKLNLNEKRLLAYAEKLGSDCPFFIINKPAVAKQKGEDLTTIELNLDDYKQVIVKPKNAVSTVEAYQGIHPHFNFVNLSKIGKTPISKWNRIYRNDFEKSVIPKVTEIGEIKEKLTIMGAKYVTMSGSGSAVFALFDRNIEIDKEEFEDYFFWSR